MEKRDKHFTEWQLLTSQLNGLSKEKTHGAVHFFIGFLESRMGQHEITGKDVCDAMQAAIKDAKR